MTDDDFARVEARDCPMTSCAAPAGSPCRTGRGKVAAQYHTARLSLDTQLDALKATGITRAVVRPELERALALAAEMRASGLAVTLVVHEHKRLGRGSELVALAEQLRAAGIGLEFLSGELQGSHDPTGIVFTVLTALSDMERGYVRDRTLEVTSRPAPGASTSAAPPSPTNPCCRWRCTCAAGTSACATSPPAWSSPAAGKRASTPHRPPCCACSAITTTRPKPPPRKGP
ncbi:recombinase family protein [Streptosporangium sp. NPDC020145]|uniref:zinc finger domain-containing protein n=1 Tax=Streptosporangium sp. NPDC020145 TaxID=3154694 RepID=UPI00341B5E8E